MPTYVSHVSAEDVSAAATSLIVPGVAAGGGNGIMLGISWRDLGTTVSAIEFGGSASSWVHGVPAKVGAGGVSVDFYYAIGLSGTADIEVFWTGTGGLLAACAVVFSDMNTSSPIGTPVSSDSTGGTATSVTDTATGEVGGMGFDILAIRDDLVSETLAPGGGQTQRGSHDDSGSAAASWSTEAGAVSQAMSWTWTNSINFAHIVVPLRANAGGGGGGGSVPIYMHHRRTQEMS